MGIFKDLTFSAVWYSFLALSKIRVGRLAIDLSLLNCTLCSLSPSGLSNYIAQLMDAAFLIMI